MKKIVVFMMAILFPFNSFAAEENKASAEAKAVDNKSKPAPGEIRDPSLLNPGMKFDLIYGQKDAPVTVLEYASLSCSHCGDFYNNVFGELKKKYFDAGKAKLVYRHFPLNLPALRAAMLVECVENEEKKKTFVNAMFKSQGEWAYSKSENEFVEKLKVIGKVGGLDAAKIDSCMKNTKLEEEILSNQVLASNGLGVASTPTIFVNGKFIEETKTLDVMVKAIDEALTKPASDANAPKGKTGGVEVKGEGNK